MKEGWKLLFLVAVSFGAQADCERPTNTDIQTAIMLNRVIPCMTQQEVLRSAGTLHDHQVTQDGDGETWFFPAHHEAFPTTITFDSDGFVSSGTSSRSR